MLFVHVGLNSTISPLLMQAVTLSLLPRMFCMHMHFKFLLIHLIHFFIFKHLNEGLHFVPSEHTAHTHARPFQQQDAHESTAAVTFTILMSVFSW